MSSYDKVVKLACKPKAAPPKAKYIDPIIAATWSDDGAVSDVCKALSPRFREPNAIVVFKALIVLHTMIRNGATDNVLSYLSQTEILRLRNVSAGNWEGYAAPENLQSYAYYLDSRIRAYRDLKHDAVRVQAETNRDMRNSASIEDDSVINTYNNRSRKDRTVKASALSGPSRSKTIAGRKLRVMTVEKGLLRETKAVHNMIDTLVECRFYLDDLEDELTITALRMLVKDLLILFQAGNEGVINVLEHYFEMSHVDAEQALNLYRHFCKQTERVVEFLGVAKKLQNLLNVPIPNLKHAPVSLAGALKEYLDDPNFEQNRGEYKAAKAATTTSKKPLEVKGSKASSATETPSSAASSSQPSQSTTANGSASTTKEGAGKDNKDMVDFFSAIEEEQPTIFNPQTNSPNAAYFQQQVASNPFAQMGFAPQPQVIPQQTGFMMPQQTAIQQPPNPFNNLLGAPQPQPTGHRPFSSFLQPQQQQPGFPLQPQQTGFPQQPQQTGFSQQPQQTGFPQQPQQTGFPQQPQQTGFPQQPQQTGFPQQQTGFLRQPQQRLLLPQSTGANPFRQSMLLPQSTGAALFTGAATAGSQSMFLNSTPQPPAGSNAFGAMTPFANLGPHSATAPSINGSADPSINVPQRPASTPLIPFASSSATSPPPAQFVKTHQTGTKNPFGPVTTPAPPVPKPPTLMELAMGANSPGSFQAFQQQQSLVQSQPASSTNGFSLNSGALSPGATDISSIASSFTSMGKPSANTAEKPPSLPSFTSLGPLFSQNTSTTTTGSTFSDSVFSSYSQQTGASATTASPVSSPVSLPLKSHLTGLKPFKPSSSFGASLLESLPPIPGSAPVTPGTTGAPPLGNSSAPSTSGFGALSSQPTGATGGFGTSLGGSTLGVGLRPQMTGGGAANPFRASMMTPSSGVPSFGSNLSFSNTTSYNPTGFPSGAFGSQPNFAQQQQNASLI